MPRPRTNDPAGVSDIPAVVHDPQRVAELTREFRLRVEYIERHHRMGRATLGEPVSFNRSLQRLKRAVSGKPVGRRARLHPELELLVNLKARQHARARLADAEPEVTGPDVVKAVQDVVAAVKPRRGAPKDQLLRQTVVGLMALVQETCGKPVLVMRDKNSLYDPQTANAPARVVMHLVQHMAPGTPVVTLVDIIRAARRAYAGQPMRFRDLYPLYGATIDPKTLLPTGGIGCRVERFEPSFPIYCP